MSDSMNTATGAIEALDAWISGARIDWRAGRTIHLNLATGEGTLYGLTFVPPGCTITGTTHSGYDPGEDAVGCLRSPGGAVWLMNPNGDPHPRYVAEKIGSDNDYTVAAVGIVWGLLVGMDPAYLADVYGDERFARVFSEWDLDRFLHALSAGGNTQ